MSRIGIIAALPAEAKCLHRNKINVALPVEIQNDIFLCLSGMGYESAQQAANKLLALNMDALISWGVAGAIDPALKSGQLILANNIITHDKHYQVSDTWRNKLSERLEMPVNCTVYGDIASNREICASVTDKKALAIKTGALAVDMESTAIAETANSNELGLLVVRAIADNASTGIPEAVIHHTNKLGKPSFPGFIGSCLTKPSQICELITLGANYKLALKTLNQIAPELLKQQFYYPG